MKTSDTQKELVAALLAARKSFPTIQKTKTGQSGNRHFKYAPLDDVFDAVMPALFANGLLLTQSTDGDVLVTRLDHISGEWRESRMPINAQHANMQSYGIELTYRRRYAIQPMLGIITEEDTDGEGGRKRNGGIDHTQQTTAAITGRSINEAEFAKLPPDAQNSLRRAVPEIEAAALTNAMQAKALVDRACDQWPQDIRNSVKMGLWSLLDSKTRSAIRRVA